MKPVKGLSWGPAAIGNATWSGARLYDVLKAAGLEDNHSGVDHIQVLQSHILLFSQIQVLKYIPQTHI